MLRRCTYNVTNIQWQNSRDWSLGFVSLLKPWVWISLMSLLYQCKLSCERLEPKISAVPLRLRMKSSTFIFLSARTLLLWRSVLSIMIAKARRNTVSGARRCLRTVGLHAQYRSENAYNTNPAVNWYSAWLQQRQNNPNTMISGSSGGRLPAETVSDVVWDRRS